MSNAINPEHYNRLNPQPKDVIRAWGLNFNLGSAVKYISRAGHKDDIVQDLYRILRKHRSLSSLRLMLSREPERRERISLSMRILWMLC